MRLEYTISATGEDQLKRTIRGIEGELKASNRRVASESRRASSGGGSVLTGGADARQADAHVRARTAHIVREHQRAERAAEQAVRNRSKLEEQAQRRKAAMQNRYFADEQRKQEALERSAARTAARNRSREERIRSRSTDSFVGGAARSARGAVGGALAIGGTALGVAGGFAAAGAILEQSQVRTRAAKLANQAGDPGLKGQLAQEAGQVRGFTGAESLSALEAFVTPTGDLGTARAILQDMGTLALATGTDFAELGAAAGQAFNVIRDTIQDPKQQIAELKDVMTTLAQQGSMGSVEIKDLATQLASLGASTRMFDGGPGKMIKTMGTLAQLAVARGGASSAAEASTAVARFGKDIITNRKNYKAAGIDIFSDDTNTKLKDPMEIIQAVLAKTGGDLTKVSNMFEVESMKAFQGFAPVWTEAEKRNSQLPKGEQLKKGEAGRAAVDAEYRKFANANVAQSVLRDRAESLLVEPEMQFKEATKAFNEAVGSQLLPVLTRLIPEFTQLIPVAGGAARVFAKLVSAFAENPFTGIGLLVGAAIVKDIVGAKIGDMVKRALGWISGPRAGGGGAEVSTAVGAGGGAATTGKGRFVGMPTGAAAAAAAGTGAMIGLTVATAIITAGVANFEMGEEDMRQSGQRKLAALRSTDPAEVRRLRDEQLKEIENTEKRGFFGGAIAGLFGDGAADALTDPERQTRINTLKNDADDIEGRMRGLEAYEEAAKQIAASAKSQEEAASKLKAVADRLGLVDLSGRGADQSIIKPGRT